jgi:hypothetical protein
MNVSVFLPQISSMQIESLRCRIILPSVACIAVPYFPTLSYKRHDLRKTFIEHKMFVLIFGTTFVRNISHSEKNSVRYYHKCTQSNGYSCQVLIKLEFPPPISEKSSNMKFKDNLPSGSRVVACGQKDRRTDRHDETNIRFSQFCECP